MEELITIIIPIYQVEKYLRKCLDSVLSQTYKNLEIILVDDGSPDKCPQICDDYANKDKRIKVIHKKNGGMSDARNVAMKIATGKYIGFIDSDDYIKSDMYEVLYEDLKKTNSDVSICNYKKVFENQKSNDDENNKEIFEYDTEEALRLLIENEFGNYAWNKLYRKDILNNIQFPEGKKMEDLAVMYKIFEKAKKVVYTNKVEYYYIQRKDSILGNIDLKLTEDLCYFVTERYNYMNEKYPKLHDVLCKDRIKFTFIYHKNICLLNKKNIYDQKKYLQEYDFFKKNFKKYRNDIYTDMEKITRLEYNLLYCNRTIFFNYYRIRNIIKKIMKK